MQRNYERTNFEWTAGGGEIEGARALIKPFERGPFVNTPVSGLRYDVRLVVSHVRMTAGVDVPFAIYRTADSVQQYDVCGQPRTLTVQSIQPVDLRFGIGAEYPIGPVAPFLDVMGGVHWTQADLSLDGVDTTYNATSFALSARAGVRLHVRRWFFTSLAGEVGLLGDVRWGAELALGFAAM